MEEKEMRYDKTFKEEAIKLSDEVGLKTASNQLGVAYGTLSEWRKKRTKYGQNAFCGSGHRTFPQTSAEQRIRELEKKNAELNRANEILKEALGFFAVSRKK